jgi:hypothetical protein
MATTTTAGFPVPCAERERVAAPARGPRKRKISPEAGRALEILGHAIEYLTDEFVHENGAIFPRDARLDAVQLLMARNREVYFACPEIPRLSERWSSFLHPHHP